MQVGRINQTFSFDAPPHEVYEALMDARKHGAFTNSPVVMSRKVGGTFRIFDGYCTGRNLELLPDQKIVQAWHFREEDWPEDHFSTCTFAFAATENGTELHFSQTDVPEQHVESLAQGWHTYYWNPMQEWLTLRLA
ncbi:MAG: hypothetical protein F6K11_13195 [Leptolyngbya sp. SIO3F4]|nr:hypothetical protein [Leptolyngbya sp. SIO3F4]